MDVFDVGDMEVLVIKHDGVFTAFEAECPHQDVPLVEGKLEDGVVTCRAHHWKFDCRSGDGINPAGICLKSYPVEVRGEEVFVGIQNDPG